MAFLFLKNRTKTHNKSELQFCFQSLPLCGTRWAILGVSERPAGGWWRDLYALQRYRCSSAGMQCRSCQPPSSSPSGCGRAQPSAAGEPTWSAAARHLPQLQPIVCSLKVYSPWPGLAEILVPPFSFSLVLSYREMPSQSFTASSDQLSLGSQLLAFSWNFVRP